jgi:XRE family transcriptional regulator, regulator of sulfur utilization
MKLHERLKEVRTQRGLTLLQVKEQSGLSVSYVSDLERGRTSGPSLETLDKLATCYQMTTADLISGIEGWGETTLAALPNGLAELLTDETIDAEAARDLSRVEFRGKRPQTREEWYELYLYLRRMMKPYLGS